MKLKDVFWHDGNIEFLEYGDGGTHLRLICSLYDDLQARTRVRCEIHVRRIKYFVMVIPDNEKQLLNRAAGAISDGRYESRQGRKTLRISLTGGYVEVCGGEIKATKLGLKG